MIVLGRIAVVAFAVMPLLVASCGGAGGGGGPRKVEVNEQICAAQGLLRMRVDRMHRVEIDNTLGSPGQNNLVLRLEGVPVVVDGNVTDNSIISDPFSTIVLEAHEDEKVSVDLTPRRTGRFRVQCNWIIQGDVHVGELTLQIVE